MESQRRRASTSCGTPTTIRVGLSEWLEARISGDGFLSATDASGTQRGIGNVQIGAKLRLWADPGGVPVLSILPTVNLPAASESKGLGSGQADFTIAVLTGTDFLTRGHVDVNYGIGRIGAGTGLPRFTQHLVSWSASAEIPGPVTPYLEGFWFSRQDPDGGPVAALDTGAIYVVNPRLALDGGVQVGLTDAAPSLSAFARDVGRDRQRPGRSRRARAPARSRPPRRRAAAEATAMTRRVARGALRVGALFVALAVGVAAARSRLAVRRGAVLPGSAVDRDRDIALPAGFAATVDRATSDQFVRVVADDVDRDGDLDVVASLGSLDLLVWKNDGAGHFTRLASSAHHRAADPAAGAHRGRRLARVERMDPERRLRTALTSHRCARRHRRSASPVTRARPPSRPARTAVASVPPALPDPPRSLSACRVQKDPA